MIWKQNCVNLYSVSNSAAFYLSGGLYYTEVKLIASPMVISTIGHW